MLISRTSFYMKLKKLIRKLNSQLRQARKYRTPFIFVVGLIVFGILQTSSVRDSDALKKIEGQTIDKRFVIRDSNSPLGQHPEIELVGITTKSLDQSSINGLLEEAQKVEDERYAKAHPELFTPIPAPVPKAEAPKAEAPKADVPKEAAPKAEAPKAEAPKAEIPKEEAPKAEVPKVEAPKADVPKEEAPKADAPKADAPAPNAANLQHRDSVMAAAQEPGDKSSAVKIETAPSEFGAGKSGVSALPPSDRNYSEALKMMRGGKWPLPRAVYAYALDRLFEMGAKVVAIDIMLVSSRPSLDGRLSDGLDKLEAMKATYGITDELFDKIDGVLEDEGDVAPSIVLGLKRLEEQKKELGLTEAQKLRINALLEREGKRLREGDDVLAEALEKYKGRVVLAFGTSPQPDGSVATLAVNETLGAALGADGSGFVGFDPDIDRPIRRVRAMTSQMRESGKAQFQSGPDDWIRFGPLAAAKLRGTKVNPPEGVEVGGKKVFPQSPVEFINYRGPEGTYEPLPIEELFNERILTTDPRYQGGNRFKDKLVFLGPLAETFHDVHPTPLGTMPGVEIHANYAAAILDNIPIKEFPEQWKLWLVVGAVLVSAVLLLGVEQVLARMGILVGVIGAYCIASYFLFAKANLMIPVILPMIALLCVGGFITIFDFAIEQLEKAHVRGVLDKYVSSNVASMVINQGDSFDQALRGQNKPVSVLFSDIRGFTTLSESRSPEVLVAQLNEYFLQMVDRVLAQGGTLQKFIGDAIMAVWGDTHSLGNDVDCLAAVRSALKMRQALHDLNLGWAELEDREELSIGVGINHGHVTVGELGHPQRMEFTCLGDGVNLAARLESATKQFGVDILVAREAQLITQDKIVYRRVDMAIFKGKTEPIHVFTPLGEVGMQVPAWLDHYHAALDQFHRREFAEAKVAFGKVYDEMGGDDFLCKMYQKRCDHYMEEPPDADWDGSYKLTEK